VLYYEVIYRWLLPSLRTRCHRGLTSFSTSQGVLVLICPSWAVSLSTNTALSCRRRTHGDLLLRSFEVHQKLVGFDAPVFKWCSTPYCYLVAIAMARLKPVSQRTSYHQPCLAFHPYPQLIRGHYNDHRFGRPDSVTNPSTWSWVDRLVSRMRRETVTHAGIHQLSWIACRFHLRIRPLLSKEAYLCIASLLNSLTHYTKGTPLYLDCT